MDTSSPLAQSSLRTRRSVSRVAGLYLGVALGAWACGSPGKLDRELFPETYTDTDMSVGAAGSPAIPSNNMGGTGGAGMVGNNPMNTGGQAGAAMLPQGGSGGETQVVPNPDVPGCDAPTLFQRPVAEGGCTQAGGGCHEGGEGSISPDLISPGVAERLMATTSSTCGDRPLIGTGADTSYLIDKVEVDASPECGFPMPFLSVSSLNDVDRQCIIEWVNAISEGG